MDDLRWPKLLVYIIHSATANDEGHESYEAANDLLVVLAEDRSDA